MFSLSNCSSTECSSPSDLLSPLLGVLAPPPVSPLPTPSSSCVGITFVGLSPPTFDPARCFSPAPNAASTPKLAKLPPLKLFLPPMALARTFSAFESESKNLLGALKMGGEEEDISEK
jgi:hypothetical protein